MVRRTMLQKREQRKRHLMLLLVFYFFFFFFLLLLLQLYSSTALYHMCRLRRNIKRSWKIAIEFPAICGNCKMTRILMRVCAS